MGEDSGLTPPPRKKRPRPWPKRPDFAGIARCYAERVIEGRIDACKFVRQGCQRHLNDLERAKGKAFPYRFDAASAARKCEFVERMPHVKGPKARTRIVLEPWQVFVVAVAYGWIHKQWKTRRFRLVYIEVPRGNAKSTLVAALALDALTADRELGGEIYSAATTRDQAKIVFSIAQQMARLSPNFRQAAGLVVGTHNMHVNRTASKFESLSADSNSLDGLNIHFAAVDELHAHKTREVYDVLETGLGKRAQPMMWCLTTAGSDIGGICYETRGLLVRVLDGTVTDETMFGMIFTIDDTDDWSKPATWRKANPNWGVSVMPPTVEALAQKAMRMPSAQSAFKRKHLDIWVGAMAPWIDMTGWHACADPGLRPEDLAGESCIMAFDLATKIDLVSRVTAFWRGDGTERHWFLFQTSYLPEKRIETAENSRYAGWAIDGKIILTPGDTIDFKRLREDVLEDAERYHPAQLAYDPWQATQLALELQAKGVPVIEYRPTVANFSPAMKEIEALVAERRIHHDGDPVLAWAMSNVVARRDAKDNLFPRKENLKAKIDPAVALIMALGVTLGGEAPQQSVYDTMSEETAQDLGLAVAVKREAPQPQPEWPDEE